MKSQLVFPYHYKGDFLAEPLPPSKPGLDMVGGVGTLGSHIKHCIQTMAILDQDIQNKY